MRDTAGARERGAKAGRSTAEARERSVPQSSPTRTTERSEGSEGHAQISKKIKKFGKRAEYFRATKTAREMLGKIEHLGIAVKDLEEAEKRYTQLLGVPPYKRETVESEHVITSFFMAGPNKIELLQATAPESAIAKFIEKRGEGIHHVAYEVEDIMAEMERLRQEGFTLLNETPKRGADDKLICFVHPRDAHGALVELCQSI